MNLLKEATKLIGWLTGALAGLVALLYSAGYVIVQTQLHLLGISALLPSGKEYYLQEGANFFLVTGQKVGQLLLGLLALVLIFCIPLSIFKKTQTGLKHVETLKKNCAGMQHQWLWQSATLLVLVILLFFLAERRKQNMEVGNDRGYANISNFYYSLLMHCLFAGVLLVATQHVAATWPFKSVIVFPFLLVFAIYLFLLPVCYAVVEKKLEFPSISFVSTFDSISDTSGELLLLWDKTRRKALWLPKDKDAVVPARDDGSRFRVQSSTANSFQTDLPRELFDH